MFVWGKKHSVNPDYILKVLGLDICSDKIVGNEIARGVYSTHGTPSTSS